MNFFKKLVSTLILGLFLTQQLLADGELVTSIPGGGIIRVNYRGDRQISGIALNGHAFNYELVNSSTLKFTFNGKHYKIIITQNPINIDVEEIEVEASAAATAASLLPRSPVVALPSMSSGGTSMTLTLKTQGIFGRMGAFVASCAYDFHLMADQTFLAGLLANVLSRIGGDVFANFTQDVIFQPLLNLLLEEFRQRMAREATGAERAMLEDLLRQRFS